jgi:phenylpropionate dioxygenase-like ring-hydroxylating dioxygenase large terminal subunit
MDLKDFWYVVCESRELKEGKVLARKVMDEWLAVFRGADGKAVALQDRCLHRAAQLSRGRVVNGNLQCPYHGWKYDGQGQVVQVPAEGPGEPKLKRRCAVRYSVTERDDYVYVRLSQSPAEEFEPFRMPRYREKGYRTVRLINRMQNNVTNCAENYIDIPHTIPVHPNIFRWARSERFRATVRRENGSVRVEYRDERSNFGIFSWFLNPSGREIVHRDNFHMPNITSVEYDFGPSRHFFITSQCVPVTDEETLTYTDLTFNYGIWNWLTAPIVRLQGQRIIDQDIEILKNQMDTIRKYGDKFMNTEADVIHVLVESIRNELRKGADPRLLPLRVNEIEFWT